MNVRTTPDGEDSQQLYAETLQLRRENDELRGEVSRLKRVRRQWARDFAIIEAQVREGQRSLEAYTALTSQPERHVPAVAQGPSSPAGTDEDADKDQLIEKLSYTCENLRQELAEAHKVASHSTDIHAMEQALDSGSVEGLLVENARLREALARAQHQPRSESPAAQPSSTLPTITPPPDAVGDRASPAQPADELALRLELAERETLALSLQNEELLRDVRHYMWLASARLISTADQAARVAAIPEAENALRLLELKSRSEQELTATVERLERERDGLQRALDTVVNNQRQSGATASAHAVAPYVDILEAEAEVILQRLIDFCGDVAQRQTDGPLVALWKSATEHNIPSQRNAPLLPSLPDSQYAGTPVHHLVGVLRGIRYVTRRLLDQVRLTL